MPPDAGEQSRRALIAELSNRDLRPRIRRFFDQRDWDVACRKRRRAYAIICAGCREPLVKLRATGHGDEVKLFWWDEDQWQPVTDFGAALPLDEALEHVAEDPRGVFRNHYESESEDPASDEVVARRPGAKQPHVVLATDTFRALLLSSSAGGLSGGLCHGGWRGLACGAVVGFLVPFLVTLLYARLRVVRTRGVALFCLSFTLFAAVGGMLGGAVNQAVGGGIGGGAAGSGIGLACGLLLVLGGRATWLVAFTGGLLLGVLISAVIGLQGHFAGTALAALAATTLGNGYRVVIDKYLGWCLPLMKQQMEGRETARRGSHR